MTQTDTDRLTLIQGYDTDRLTLIQGYDTDRLNLMQGYDTDRLTLIQGYDTGEGQGTKQDTQTDWDPVGVGGVVLTPLSREQITTQFLKNSLMI